VTDFGLAKLTPAAPAGPGAGKGGSTRSGAILGTPEYMAPEQARGEARLTTAADVYGLGGLLYALLAGRPPFRGATAWETLRQVQAQEPVPPSAHRPGCPRDLETICLKSLAKEPGRRYASAEALAEDLERWLAGEPIRARPVGRLERAWLWARRYPAVAGLLTAFVVALLLGIAVSTYFAFASNANFLEAHRRERDTNEALVKVKEREQQLEETLARSLLRPLGHQANVVTDPELEALWELAGSGERVRMLFVEQALQHPLTARQLRNRADMAVHAVVGLDPDQRECIEKLLLARLRDPKTEPRIRADSIIIGAALDDWSLEFAQLAARQTLDTLGKTTDPFNQAQLGHAVASLARRVGPDEAAWLARPAAREALEALGKTADPFALSALAQAVAALTPRLPPDESGRYARTAARQMFDALAKTTNPSAMSSLLEAVAALAPRLGPREAVEVWRHAIDTWSKTADPLALMEASAVLLARHGPEVLQALGETGDPLGGRAVAQAVAALAPPVGPQVYILSAVAEAVPEVAPPLEAKEARALARQTLDELGKTTNSFPSSALADRVAALAPLLGPEEARAAARQALHGLGMTTNSYAKSVQANAVAALAPWLPPEEARALARQTLDELGKTTDAVTLSALAEAVAALLAKPGPEATSQRACLLATVVGNGAFPLAPLPGLTRLQEAARPLPGCFTEQELVNFLKMPTCQRSAREVILRQLGHQCGRPFAHQWEFVAWARQHRPDLDLTSPPVRPSPP
jgi:hypothetical protein